MTVVDESTVLNQCLLYLHMKNIFAWRNNTGAVKIGSRFIRYGFKGSSDILGILPDGRFLAIECKKSKGGKVSEDQKNFLENVKKNGGVAIVANSVETLINELQEKENI